MKIIEGKEQGYINWKAKNSDPYGNACFEFAEQWAELMEQKINNGEKLDEIADRCCREINKKPEFGITGFMYGVIVSILSESWIHGRELKEWHNLSVQLNHEGEEANKKGTVLNPALLKIKSKEN